MPQFKLDTQNNLSNIRYTTPEYRAKHMENTDPLFLNFRVMLDRKKPYGLFAPESEINSALAYLKRIGELARYEMLQQWIEKFDILIRKYDFLFLECQGLEEVFLKKPWEQFTEEDGNISFMMRETVDMLVQSIVSQWKHIWYDYERKVEVLPVNLRRFDLSVLVYGSGYYDMDLYGTMPTVKKLSDEFFVHNSTEPYEFSHHLFNFKDVEINIEESGKGFFAAVNNTPSDDYIQNTLGFKFKFCDYSGVFANVFGIFDPVKVLAIAASSDTQNNKQSYAQNKITQALSPNTFLGDALNKIKNPKKLVKKIGTEALQATTDYADRVVDSGIAKINNLVSSTFSDNFYQLYNRYLVADPTKNMLKVEQHKTGEGMKMQQPEISGNMKIPDTAMIKTLNIYDRKTF